MAGGDDDRSPRRLAMAAAVTDRVVDRIGTANIRYTLSPDDVEAAIRKMLREGVELLGLNEVGTNRNALIEGICRGSHWDWTRAKGGGPTIWNRTRYTPVRAEGHPVRLAGKEYVGHLIGRKSRLPASIATECIFEDEILGCQVASISYHLTAEIQTADGKYRKDLGHLLRVLRHKREKRRLRKRRRFHLRRGRLVYLHGDGNFDGLQLRPSVSCWEGRKGGTLGWRAVDAIHTDIPAESVHTVVTKSDHRGVVATYLRKTTKH